MKGYIITWIIALMEKNFLSPQLIKLLHSITPDRLFPQLVFKYLKTTTSGCFVGQICKVITARQRSGEKVMFSVSQSVHRVVPTWPLQVMHWTLPYNPNPSSPRHGTSTYRDLPSPNPRHGTSLYRNCPDTEPHFTGRPSAPPPPKKLQCFLIWDDLSDCGIFQMNPQKKSK